jgi:glycosyltransferase involved in cell wall biosynthesis
MTTVEAMAGGCVPVVIDRAGQKEIVREGVDGYRWSAPEQLLERTAQLARDEALRARLAGSARERAGSFDEDAFADRWRRIADRHDLLGGSAWTPRRCSACAPASAATPPTCSPP